MKLLNECFYDGEENMDWHGQCMYSIVFVPLYKGKSDKNKCYNSRGISLLSLVGISIVDF